MQSDKKMFFPPQKIVSDFFYIPSPILHMKIIIIFHFKKVRGEGLSLFVGPRLVQCMNIFIFMILDDF
jgi:hypothetical protein